MSATAKNPHSRDAPPCVIRAPRDLRAAGERISVAAVLFTAIASRVIPLLAGSANLVGDTKVEVSGPYCH